MAGTYKLRRNKLACVSSKFISLKHSLTRVFDVRYMDILFVRPIITGPDNADRHADTKLCLAHLKFFKELLCLNKSIAIQLCLSSIESLYFI